MMVALPPPTFARPIKKIPLQSSEMSNSQPQLLIDEQDRYFSTGERTPFVSVVIPAFNVAKYIAETLASVFAQTFKDFEVIVINDGSPDTEELERVLRPYLDRITYIKEFDALEPASLPCSTPMTCGCLNISRNN